MGIDDKAVNKYFVRDEEAEVDLRLAILETRHILDNIKIMTPVLDLGVGHGVVVDALLKKFGECSVVESSKRLVEAARLKYSNGLHVYHDDFETFDPPHKFSTIMATGILHHVDNPLEVLKRIVGWLEPGGNIVISVPNGHSVHRAMGVALGLQTDLLSLTETGLRSGVQHVFSPRLIEQLVGGAGLRVRRQITSYLKVTSNAQMIELGEPKLEQLFKLAEVIPSQFHATLVLDCVRQ
jgi:trans-aconitate methyltransferase